MAQLRREFRYNFGLLDRYPLCTFRDLWMIDLMWAFGLSRVDMCSKGVKDIVQTFVLPIGKVATEEPYVAINERSFEICGYMRISFHTHSHTGSAVL